jgi:hypothetical protein
MLVAEERHMRWIVCLLAASTAIGSPDTELASRFLGRDDRPLTRYVAWRRLEARNDRFKMDGWLEACVSQSPESGFRFAVRREGGSGYIRAKVLRKALDSERELMASGEAGRSSLSADNYDFEPEPIALDPGEVALRLRPKRRDALLINGRAIVSDSDADLIRVEGRLIRNPSFWTRSVDVVRRYGWRGGVRVPIETTSAADVRLAGQSTFRMTIDYDSVNGAGVDPRESGRISCLVTQN